jgi:hypothetical protein
LDWFG